MLLDSLNLEFVPKETYIFLMMQTTRRKFVASALIALAFLPFQSVQACIGTQLRATIDFGEVPDTIPPGLTARHFHLTNQIPEFEDWRGAWDITLEREDIEMRHFSFIGLGAPINPWTHWLTSRMPDWLVGEAHYVPIFAPTSSCTIRFRPFDEPIDQTVLLVGQTLTMTNGNNLFAAASQRSYDGKWTTATTGF